ncbi:MAG TPA: pilus assembly protein TadG-related protein [Hyphomicrobiaceae bacterium]|nr:pilus assembly protein TadG-related protein [Hyphomicrobiaceae bacterium]
MPAPRPGFARAQDGTVAVIFALGFSAVLLMAAVAIDLARTQTAYLRSQNALDAATLAAAHSIGLPDEETAATQTATAFYQANTVNRHTYSALTTLTVDSDAGQVTGEAQGNVTTTLLKAFGVTQVPYFNSAIVKKGKGSVEVALVLDNSGSMAGTPISDLRQAAQNLLNVVFAGAEGTDKVKIGVVPFAAAVNVGAQYAGASWMDTGGLSPVHYENFAEHRTRFDLFSAMGVAWGGCVEARPSPHDVTDSVPTTSDPASLFVPMFAPDEPDSANSEGSSYQNNYVYDTGGSCPAPPPATCLRTSRRGNCLEWSSPPPIPAAEAQARTCKYDDATPSGQGPNYLCDSKPVMPLTEDKDALATMIGGMQAKGGTNILEGLMWGWRLVSPEPPFTEGRPYDAEENTKYIVLMTDGENWHQAMSNQNKSTYHSFGYAVKGRLGTTYSTSALINQMNTKTLAACSNAKAAGIKVYTIAFRLAAGPSRDLLAACASSLTNAYVASDGTALIAAFESIGREIAKLRVAG